MDNEASALHAKDSSEGTKNKKAIYTAWKSHVQIGNWDQDIRTFIEDFWELKMKKFKKNQIVQILVKVKLNPDQLITFGNLQHLDKSEASMEHLITLCDHKKSFFEEQYDYPDISELIIMYRVVPNIKGQTVIFKSFKEKTRIVASKRLKIGLPNTMYLPSWSPDLRIINDSSAFFSYRKAWYQFDIDNINFSYTCKVSTSWTKDVILSFKDQLSESSIAKIKEINAKRKNSPTVVNIPYSWEAWWANGELVTSFTREIYDLKNPDLAEVKEVHRYENKVEVYSEKRETSPLINASSHPSKMDRMAKIKNITRKSTSFEFNPYANRRSYSTSANGMLRHKADPCFSMDGIY
jgi:hypothetical protein